MDKRDIEAVQGEAGKTYRERIKTLVIGKVRFNYCPRTWLMARSVRHTAKQRDDLRDVVHGHLDDGVGLLELKFQPLRRIGEGRD